MVAKIIDGRKIAEKIRKNVSVEVQSLKSKYKVTPNIVTIKIGSNPESDLYLRLRNKACEKVGILSKTLELPTNVSENEVVKVIKDLNLDKKVHGILIQFPIPDHLNPGELIEKINPDKDVEGFTPYNMGLSLIHI